MHPEDTDLATEEPRETFQSSWGTILTTAGAAIGLGNIWRFPYMMGLFGGGAFLLVYLAVVVLFGIPGLMVEWTLGRRTRRGPLGAFQRAGLRGGGAFGYLLLLTVTMAASYYAVVIAWVLFYGAAYLVGSPPTEASAFFEWLTAGLWPQAGALLVTVGLGCGCMYWGVRRGIERVSRLVTPLFFAITAVLIVRALTLPGALEGLSFYLTPRWSQFTGATFLAATGQAYFSLALGGTFMVIYGSYMRADENIPRSAVGTALADASAAFIAGLVVVPSLFAFDIDLASGPPLLFVVMPQVFQRVPLGGLFGALFFLAIFVIAMLSLVAAYQVLAAAMQDGWNWSRRRVLFAIFVAQSLLAVPSMLSLRYLFGSDLIWGSVMQPVGAVLSVFALAWCSSRVALLNDMSRGAGRQLPGWLYYWIKYVIPLAVVSALVAGLLAA